jgi:predicted  nucleic acid-binding Zn-ribbon protein
LDAESQSAYQALWKRTHGQPVAVMTSTGSCARCGVTQTTAAAQQVLRGDGLVTCGGCGRILVALSQAPLEPEIDPDDYM